MESVKAWDQLRSGGRQGSAIADELIAFAGERWWRKAVLTLARNYADQATEDYRQFAEADDQQLITT